MTTSFASRAGRGLSTVARILAPVALSCAPLAGCYVEPEFPDVPPDPLERPTTYAVSSAPAMDSALGSQVDALEEQRALLRKVDSCVEREWRPDCADVSAAIDRTCPADGAPLPAPMDISSCVRFKKNLRAAAARHGCTQGNLAQCQAACGAESPDACVALANMYFTGHGAPKDVARANAIAAATCSDGSIEACTQRALWQSESSPLHAAELAMQACRSGPGTAAATGCTLWMQLFEGQGSLPRRETGLREVCRREQRGAIAPGKNIPTSIGPVSYSNAACVWIKELGVR